MRIDLSPPLPEAQSMQDRIFWRAVLARDPRFNDRFVYAVRSTGVYCRPICPSRRPARDQVLFFSGPGAAEQAGFRPCRRCHPRQPADPLVERTKQICRYMEANGEERLTLAGLASRAGVSARQLQRIFKRATGITPREYAEALRLGRVKKALKKGDDVTTALYKAGYGSSSRLYERSSAQLGMTPAVYGRGGAGMKISYTIAASRFGRVLVAWTERGICALSFGGAGKPLQAFLTEEYPKAEIRRHHGAMTGFVQDVLAHLQGRQPHIDLPVDVQATAFQRRVWQELQSIPYGETRTYSQIARSLGQPAAIRAVARACATNPVSIVIPCHRVIRQDGSLGGYRWGLGRKRALLAQERQARAGEGTNRENETSAQQAAMRRPAADPLPNRRQAPAGSATSGGLA
jgi:AraC family transcriptional regulator of adaptative response/methylated-DNA-[protein]-cysteine methyltransferase